MCIASESDLLGDLGDPKLCMRQHPFSSFQSCVQHILDDGNAISLLIQPLQIANAEVIPSCDPGKSPVLLWLGMDLKMQMLDLLLRAGREIVPDAASQFEFFLADVQVMLQFIHIVQQKCVCHIDWLRVDQVQHRSLLMQVGIVQQIDPTFRRLFLVLRQKRWTSGLHSSCSMP